MRKTIIILLVMLSSMIHAENYPYRSDFLWVTVPDHADWLYRCGESATIDIQLYKYGIPRDASISWTLADDMLQPDRKGTLTMRNGRAKLNIGTSKKPGFRDLVLTTTIDGTVTTHHVKVGFSVDKIRPYTEEPADFMQFWADNPETANRDVEFTVETAPEFSTDRIQCQLLKIKTDKTHYVYAYLTFPRDAKPASCPAVICPPGAGIKTIKEPLRHRYYAENGFMRIEMEIHGLDPRTPETTFKEIQSAFAARGNNYLENGLDNRDNYYMRHVYLALRSVARYAMSNPLWDGRNLIFQGGSQGGALALIGAALVPETTAAVANHPALSDMAAYSMEGRTGGYPHFNRTPGMMTPEKLKVMAYYDVVNFSRHISCPTLITWGYNDNTCPPTTSYAVFNTLSCPKEALLTPINEHWTSDATERYLMEWIKQHLK